MKVSNFVVAYRLSLIALSWLAGSMLHLTSASSRNADECKGAIVISLQIV
jgi:hypothetical protein